VITAVAESAIAGGIGVDLDLGTSPDAWIEFFGEAPGLFVVSGDAAALERLEALTPVMLLGTVGGERITARCGDLELDEPLDELAAAWRGGLAPYFP